VSAAFSNEYIATKYTQCVDTLLQFIINTIRRLADGDSGGCNGHSVAGCIFNEAALLMKNPERYIVKTGASGVPEFKNISDADTRYFDNVGLLNSTEARQMLYRMLLDTRDPINRKNLDASGIEPIPGRNPLMMLSVMTGMIRCLMFGDSEEVSPTLPPSMFTWYLLRPDCYKDCPHRLCETSLNAVKVFNPAVDGEFNPVNMNPYFLGMVCGSPMYPQEF
jgi:hypothetical protein